MGIKYGYVLSYQARTSLYEKLDVKREIAEILVQNSAGNISSHTDSTIYFENIISKEENPAAKWRNTLQNEFYKSDLTKGLNYTLAICINSTDGNPVLWTKYEDAKLNDRFRKIVAEIRKELNKPEPKY